MFLFFQGTFVVSVPLPLPSRPGAPDVDSVSRTAALNVSLSALRRWDSFQHFTTSDAGMEGPELIQLLNAAMLLSKNNKNKQVKESEWRCGVRIQWAQP